MQIISTAFAHQKKMPSKFTCDGLNVSPPLLFSDVPDEAESLVLLMDDPDAQGWVHWVVYNIDPLAREVHEDAIPEHGVEAFTSFQTVGYGGACPPNGTHRYSFRLYALDTHLPFDGSEHVDKHMVEDAMQGHVLDEAELIGLYSKE